MWHLRKRYRLVAGTVALAALTLLGCTPSEPPPPPTTPSASPTMRPEVKDMYDAVKAYYEGFEEVNQIVRSGGAEKPTATMKQTMTADYLEFMSEVIKPSTYEIKGEARIDGYNVGAQTPTTIPITGCENESDVKAYDKQSGEDVTVDTTGLRMRSLIAAKGEDGRWRIARIVEDRYVQPNDWQTRSCMAVTERPS